MRKKVLNGKRVMALALALSLTIGEAGVVVAAPVGAEQTETVAVDAASEEAGVAEQEADATVSANEGEVTAPETEQPKEAVEEEEDIDAEEAVDGTLSKVIGVEVSGYSYGKIKDAKGNVVLRYMSGSERGARFEVPGKVESDPASGLYNVNGKWYDYANYDAAKNTTTTYTGYEMTQVAGQPENFNDPNTGLYLVNGAYYTYLRSDNSNVYVSTSYQVVPMPAMTVTTDYSLYSEVEKAVRKTYGVYTSTTPTGDGSTSPDYYDFNGKKYSDYSGNYRVVGRTSDGSGKTIYTVVPYFSSSNEMLLDTMYAQFSWNDLNAPNGLKNAAGQELKIGYEVEVNGAIYKKNFNAYDAAGATHEIMYSTNYSIKMTNGQSVTIRVRGVYYHEENKVGTGTDGTPVGTDINVIDTFGEWSEPVSYTYTAPQAIAAVPAVSAAFVKGETTINGSSANTEDVIRVSFTTVPQATEYTVYKIATKKQVALTGDNFYKVYDADYDALDSLGLSDIRTDSEQLRYGETTFKDTPTDGYNYYYYAVVPEGVADAEHYYNTQSLESIAAIGTATVPEASVDLPQVANLRVEKYTDGNKALVWDKTEKKVAIFAYEAANFPAYYTAKLQDPTTVVTTADGKQETHKLWRSYWSDGWNQMDLSKEEWLALEKVQYHTTDGINGSMSLDNFSMKPGRTYYFVAYTYDSAKKNSNQTPYVYSGTSKTTNDKGVETATPVTYNYYTYTPISAASAVVSVKAEMRGKPSVSTFVTKNSVKLTMQNVSGTGYEIYRKSGKKFKKIAVTNSDVYMDEGLKANTTYTYKVRAYYYNRDTKEKYYSDYRVLSVKTADAANIDIMAVKASKTAVKVSWTKVANASKYEVYRSNSANADPKVLSKKYSASGIKTTLANNRFELVKTLSKSKKSYTDKKLTAGESYTYVVVAYYKAGNKTEYVSGTDSAYLGLDKSVYRVDGVISGSKAKITWEKDKYASKYEVEYTVYDVNGNPKSSQPAKATTKKAGYTVSGLAAGESVSVRVRAVGKGSVYSDWSSERVIKNLTAVKGIKAVATSKKNAAGQTVKGVKITWKAVAGAKYYKVYRSTQEGVYDKDAKVYYLPAGRELIVKEANDNFYTKDSSLKRDGYRTDDVVYYKEYKEIKGSVTGTSAVDYADFPAGVTYYYTVVAYGEAPVASEDSHVSSNQVAKAAKVTADGINTVTLKNSKKGKVTVTFNTVPGAKKYTIYRATKKNGKYTKVATVKVTKKNKNKKSLSYTGKAVKKKTYYYKVVAEGTNELKADMNIESAVKKIKVKK